MAGNGGMQSKDELCEGGEEKKKKRRLRKKKSVGFLKTSDLHGLLHG